MSRINIEQSIFTDARFFNLSLKLGSRSKALGALVFAWEMAQRFFLKHESLIPLEDWIKLEGNKEIIESGLAELNQNEVYVKGGRDHFNWIDKRSKAGQKGGRSSAKSRLEKYGTAIPINATNSEANVRQKPILTEASSSSSSSSSTSTYKNGKKEIRKTATKAACTSLKVVKGGNSEIDEVVKQVIPALIEATGTKFQETGQELRLGVARLLKLGYTAQDMVLVAKHRSKAWRHDSKMSAYLRPSTLFRPSKFEEYLPMAEAYFEKAESLFGAL